MTYNSSKTGAQVDNAVTDVENAKAASPTDTTADRLLKVGDFGVGGVTDLGSIVTADLNTITDPGVYGVLISDTSPTGGSRNALVVEGGQGDSRRQTLIAMGGSPPDVVQLTRTKSFTNVWGTWQEILHTGNTPIQSNATNLILDSGARLGIGTGTPLRSLTVGTGAEDDSRVPANTPVMVKTSNYDPAISGGYGGFIHFVTDGSLPGFCASDIAAQVNNPAASNWAKSFNTGTANCGFYKIQNGTHRFFTDASIAAGATYTPTERLRIDSSGNVLIGTTGLGAGRFQMDVTGAVNAYFVNRSTSGQTGIRIDRTVSNGEVLTFVRGTTVVGSISISTTGTLFNVASDQRLKTNITDAADSATKIDALQVRQFDWKADGKHQEYGLIAQELEPICPDAVSKGETDDDMWGVDYSKLVPLMLKEIQSLRARVAELENKQ